ncbi:unnamed protein product [Brassicogethes aeneus]|uniref:Tudor domain-containing protein n=1 Tax=Brassicogethes aeneus TaxID=1431903 RepID=A0A9P0B8G0_BRAAE|nr:unnamed protein product [Brassicogethes aeneus]
MDINQSLNLYITHVEPEGPFLKLWGQIDKQTPILVEGVLKSLTPQLDNGLYDINLENVQHGKLVCAKYKDNKYYRARIINVSPNGYVEVNFFDFGNREILPFQNLRHLQAFPPSFISIPPLAHSFIFAEVHTVGEWNAVVFEQLAKELKYREVQCTCVGHGAGYPLIKLYYGGADLSIVLNGLIQCIPVQGQQAVLLSMSINKGIPIMPPPAPQLNASPVGSTEINTYKAVTLEPGREYSVYVSFVNDGPCHFSVQLDSSLDCLGKLMTDMNSIPLKMLEDVPIPGTICLAKCEDDGNICRAVVTNEVDNQFKVFYVDFGNYEVIPSTSLFQIPFKFVLPKVMAIRLGLANLEKSTVTIEMQCAFKKFVDDRLLHMKVLPAATRLAVPKCELWDPLTGTTALEVVYSAARNAYPEPMSLNRGFSQPVKVSFVYSCNRFYVQLCSKEEELLNMMLDLQNNCASSDCMDPSTLTVGLPCCALYEGDQKWYRSQIVEILPENAVKVRYIDYGNEEVVSNSVLRLVQGEQLTVLRPQAIECCLNGYQNMGIDEERDNLLEELILENQFTMKVVDMLGNKALIELIDGANYNVASLLLDKIASSKSQVSPMLVQANNRIEHRKNITPPNNRDFRQERKPGRENKQWNDRQSDKPWRQDEQNNRQNDKFTNEGSPEQGSWRQNNKGFNNRDNDDNRTDYKSNENRQNDRFNNRGGDRRDNNRNQSEWCNNKTGSSHGAGDSWETNNTNASNDSGYKETCKYRQLIPKSDSGHRELCSKHRQFRDGSEVSSSGSEKSFHKGPRTSSRNDKFPRQFDKPKNLSFGNDSWNVSAVTLDPAPVDAKFTNISVVGITTKVSISWFHNPTHFYCQLKDNQDSFKKLMEDIQIAYKDRKPESVQCGAPIIGLFPEDNVLYRSHVLEVLDSGMYKVLYVDFGNVSVISKVWPIEKKFMNLPAQAVCCQLVDISPVDGVWSDPDNYERYFDKEEFDCGFISENDKIFQVELSHNQVDIGQQLIQDGYAVSLSQAVTADAVDLSILLNQQFRCVLKSVNNLSDVIIALYSGFLISCKAHNLESATETFEDTLKANIELPMIIYVDNVLGNTLEVTFYDNEGNKIVIVNPDEGAFDTVESLCPYMVTSPTIYGFVSHVEVASVFIQSQEVAETVAYLLEKLYEAYNASTQESPIIPEEGFVYAVLSEDENWYRGKVVSFDDEKALVNFIDYGNNESVPFKSLRDLDAQFNEISICVIEVAVSAPTENLTEKDVTATIFYGENGWEGEIVAQEQEPELKSNELVFEPEEIPAAPVQEEYIQEEPIQEEPQPPIQEECLADAVTVEPECINASLGISVYVSHVDSPSDFYVQLSEALDDIEELQTQLQELAPEMPVLEAPVAGVMCAAPYSVDQQWYRAQVLDADEDITTVRFVDYGNTDVIDNKATQIKALPPNWLSTAVYATRCGLKLKPVEEEWSTEAHDRFVGLCEGDVTAEFLNQDEKINYVELYLGDGKITDVLTEERLALSYEFVEESKVTCFASHINSPSEFWIQLENCADELERIAEQLSNAHAFPELEDPAPGTLCAALFDDDGMWYRARVLSNTVAGVEALFIDYGNSSLAENLRQIPEELVVTAPLAQKCSLQRPEGVDEWSQEATDKFNEIAADGQTIFTIRKISTGETSLVEMFADGANILHALVPVTEEGYLRNFENANSFAIEKNGHILPDKFRLESDGASWSDECEEYFKSIADKGEPLQILFLPENTVRLYLNGTNILRLKPKSDKKIESVPNETVVEDIDSENISLKNSDEQTAENISLKNSDEQTAENISLKNSDEQTAENISLEEEIRNLEIKKVEIEAQSIVAEIIDKVTDVTDNIAANEDPSKQEKVCDEKDINERSEDNVAEMYSVVDELVNSIEECSSKNNITEMSHVIDEIVDAIGKDSTCEEEMSNVVNVIDEIVDAIGKDSTCEEEMSNVVNVIDEIVDAIGEDSTCEEDNIKEMYNVVNDIVDAIGKPTGDVGDKDDSVKDGIKSNNSSENINDSKPAATEV